MHELRFYVMGLKGSFGFTSITTLNGKTFRHHPDSSPTAPYQQTNFKDGASNRDVLTENEKKIVENG